MKLTILGYWGGFPLQGGGSSSYLLSSRGKHLLIDTGSGSASHFSKIADYRDIQGIILTHWHHDHVADILAYEHAWKVLMDTRQVDCKLTVYSPEDDQNIWKNLNLDVIDLKYFENDQTFEMGGFTCEPFSVKHTIPCFGLRFLRDNKIVTITSDTAYFSDLRDRVNGSDILITEITNIPGSKHSSGNGHMSPSEAMSLVENNQISRIILSHFPSDIDPQWLKKELNQQSNVHWMLASDVDSIIL